MSNILLFYLCFNDYFNLLSKDGYLFDKEVILQYIITKKNEFHRKLKEYEKLKKEDNEENNQKIIAENNRRLAEFLKSENNIVTKPIDGFKSGNSYYFYA